MPDMAYKRVVITEFAKTQFIDCFQYIYYELQNPLAADSFLKDYQKTLDTLARIADGLPLCEDPELAAYGLRLIHFRHHRYKLLYRVKSDTIIIDAVYHDLQELRLPF